MIPLNDFDYAPNARDASDWQNALEEQLAVIDGICREHDLKYFLAYGGLIGAIRHRGMIPWDNDADICMFEEDYLKLQKLSNEGKFPEGYKLIDRSSEDDYSLLFGRIIKQDTSCPISTAAFNNGQHGVFIDVFILFPVPEEQEAQDDCVVDFLVWEEMQCQVKRRSKFRPKLFRERWEYARQLELEQGREVALKYCEDQFRSKMPEHSAKCIHGSGGAYMGYPVLDTAWFKEAVYKPFGTHEFAAPVGYLQFIRRHYGNSWRTFPGGESFKPYSGANLNIPGDKYSEDYMQFIDVEESVSDFDTLKQLKMREMLANSVREPLIWGIKAELKAAELNKAHKKDLNRYKRQITPEAIERTDLDLDLMATIQQETMDIIIYQTRSKLKTWRLALPYNPGLLSAALWSHYLSLPDFWTVQKTISAQRADEKHCAFNDTELNRRLDRAIAATGDLYEAIDEVNTERVAACLSVLDSICPNVRHARVGHAFLHLLETQDNPAHCNAVRAMVEEWLKTYDGDDYLRLFAAKLADMEGDRQAATDHFAALAANSMNGMILLDASDYCKEQGIPFKVRNLSSIPPYEPGPKRVYPNFRSISGALKRARAKRTEDLDGLTDTLKKLHAEMKPYEKKVAHYQALRRLTSDRIAAWERTYPRKQALLDAAAAGKMGEVRNYGRPYIEAVYRLYDNDHLGLAIDQEITEACLPIFREDRGEEFVKEYLDLIFEPHKESIIDMLRRKGIDHPYLHMELKTEK